MKSFRHNNQLFRHNNQSFRQNNQSFRQNNQLFRQNSSIVQYVLWTKYIHNLWTQHRARHLEKATARIEQSTKTLDKTAAQTFAHIRMSMDNTKTLEQNGKNFKTPIIRWILLPKQAPITLGRENIKNLEA